MAGKKKAAAKPAAKPKKEKAEKKPKVAKAAAAEIGHNSRIPTLKELQPYFKRLDTLFEQMASKRGEFMIDIKTVRGEAASGLGVSRAIFNMYYDKYRAEERFAERLADLEPNQQDDMDRLMAAGQKFGADTPFGAYCIAQGKVRPGANAEAHDEVQPPPSKLVAKDKTPPAPAAANDEPPRGKHGFSVGMSDGDDAETGEDAGTKH